MNLHLNEDGRADKLWPNIIKQSCPNDVMEHMEKWIKCHDPKVDGAQEFRNEMRRYLTEKFLTCPVNELASAVAETVSCQIVKFLDSELKRRNN